MDSRLLDTLNAQASSTRDPVVWARAVCRAASHFARHGKTTEALTSISVVRAQFGNELHHEVASWLMLAEGVLHFSQFQIRESFDRIRRAYGLAVALRTESALPSCAAWMAHFEYNECQFDKMVAHLEEALNLATADDHQARARACLVLADSYQTAGEFSLARPWYDKARLHAVAEGDNATLSAIFYNVAAMRAANVRLADTFGFENTKDAHRVAMETSSSYHYDHAIGITALTFLTQMLRGLILTIDKKFADALDVFATVNEEDTPKRLVPLLYADKAWCTLNIGLPEEAASLANIAESLSVNLTDSDDLAYAHSRIAQVFERCGKTSEALDHRLLAKANLEKHREGQAQLLEILRGMKI